MSSCLSDNKMSEIEMVQSAEEPGSIMDELKMFGRNFIIENLPRIVNEGNERALKLNISQDQAIDELFPGTNSKFLAPLHANMAKYIMENEGEEDGGDAMEFKLIQIEIEKYFFHVAQNADVGHILDVLFEDMDMLITVTEIVRERMEIIEETLNFEHASVRDIRVLAGEIFNLVMDVVLLINQAKKTTDTEKELD